MKKYLFVIYFSLSSLTSFGQPDRGLTKLSLEKLVFLPLDKSDLSPSNNTFKTLGNVQLIRSSAPLKTNEALKEKVWANFQGGSLVSTISQLNNKSSLDNFTVYLHLFIKKNNKAGVFFYGNKQGGVRIFTRMAGTDSSLRKWDKVDQNYIGYTGEKDSTWVLEAEITLKDKTSPGYRLMRIGVPFATIGTEQWHKVFLRFSGAKLDLFVDGVLVDEEFPVGEVVAGEDLLLGGEINNSQTIVPNFNGGMKAAILWKYALPEEELIKLSGGRDAVNKRVSEILGPPKTKMQYFTPPGHNVWTGDPMCYFHKNVFHLLYLRDRRHGTSKFGAGGHAFAHATTTDLKTWKHQPDALPIDQQWETLGTGTMLYWKENYYLFYGLHSDRIIPDAAVSYDNRVQKFKESGVTHPIAFDTLRAIPMGATFATSKDGIHFAKSLQLIHPSQNPSVFLNDKSNRFEMLAGYGSDGVSTSSDILHWKKEKDLIPYLQNSPYWNTGECQSFFEWNQFSYIIGGRTGFFMAKNRNSPYLPAQRFMGKDNHPGAPRWDVYDGLWVPMVGQFKNNRQILAGWLENGGDYAGTLVFRELIQEPDGTLGMKWPEEMIPTTGEPVPLVAGNGRVDISHTLDLESEDFKFLELDSLKSNVRISMQVESSSDTEAFGVNLLGEKGYRMGCELQFFPSDKLVQWSKPLDGKPSKELITFSEIVSKNSYQPLWKLDRNHPEFSHIPFWGKDFAITGVEGLGKRFVLDIIIKKEKNNVFIIDACIDGRRTIITWREELNGSKIALFVKNGKVRFRDIKVRPLMD